jgi:predicted Zn-dependent protease with MMP-like domain
VEFAELVRMAQAEVAALNRKLPEDISPLAARVAVHFERTPDETLVAEGFEPDLLGLFDGTAYHEEFSADLPSPPQIFLYLENLFDFAEGDEILFREEVGLTYLHELGHYLGWDEDDLAARGLE